MFAPLLQKLRHRRPLIHTITNYVTTNDCANMLLAPAPPPSWPMTPRRPPRSPPGPPA